MSNNNQESISKTLDNRLALSMFWKYLYQLILVTSTVYTHKFKWYIYVTICMLRKLQEISTYCIDIKFVNMNKFPFNLFRRCMVMEEFILAFIF